MKKLSMLMALAFFVVLTTVAITPVTFAQEPLDIPNIQGLWKVSITEYGTG